VPSSGVIVMLRTAMLVGAAVGALAVPTPSIHKMGLDEENRGKIKSALPCGPGTFGQENRGRTIEGVDCCAFCIYHSIASAHDVTLEHPHSVASPCSGVCDVYNMPDVLEWLANDGPEMYFANATMDTIDTEDAIDTAVTAVSPASSTHKMGADEENRGKIKSALPCGPGTFGQENRGRQIEGVDCCAFCIYHSIAKAHDVTLEHPHSITSPCTGVCGVHNMPDMMAWLANDGPEKWPLEWLANDFMYFDNAAH